MLWFLMNGIKISVYPFSQTRIILRCSDSSTIVHYCLGFHWFLKSQLHYLFFNNISPLSANVLKTPITPIPVIFWIWYIEHGIMLKTCAEQCVSVCKLVNITLRSDISPNVLKKTNLTYLFKIPPKGRVWNRRVYWWTCIKSRLMKYGRLIIE